MSFGADNRSGRGGRKGDLACSGASATVASLRIFPPQAVSVRSRVKYTHTLQHFLIAVVYSIGYACETVGTLQRIIGVVGLWAPTASNETTT